MDNVQLHLVETFEDAQAFMEWMKQPRTWLGFDTETGGLEWWDVRLRTVQIGDATAGWTIPYDHWGGLAVQAFNEYDGPIAAHNAKYDLHMLERYGFRMKRHNVHDSMLMVGLIEPLLWKGLKWAAKRHVTPMAMAMDKRLNEGMSKNGWGWDDVPIEYEPYWQYAALDPVLAAVLAEKMWPLLSEANLMRAYEVELALMLELTDMEGTGLLLDMPYVHATQRWLRDWEGYLMTDLVARTGLKNPNSDAQVVKWFQDRGHKFTVLTDKGNISLAAEVLESIEGYGDLPSTLLDFRRKSKLRSTYFDAFIRFGDENGRLHTQINQMKARTARMSSEKPNLQNIPARTGPLVRNAFIAREGHTLIAADYDQIEYRIMVSRANEGVLIDAINRGEDLHTFMASVVHGTTPDQITPHQRGIMKNANFGFLYGAGDAKFALMAGITEAEAKYFRALYQDRFPNIASYTRGIQDLIERDGVVVTPYLGRRQAIEDRQESYKAINYVTQGEAGDVLKNKMVALGNTGVGEFMRLPIHDEILFEVPDEFVPDATQIIREVMPENEAFSVPLSVGVDTMRRWGDKYE